MTAAQAIQERRLAQRIAMRTQITVHFTDGGIRWAETDATLVDLSSEGLLIDCDRMPRQGQHILLGLKHPERGLCAAWGETVRRNGCGGFGVQFKRINNSLGELVREIADTPESERAGLLAEALDAKVWIDTDDPF